MFVCVCVCCIKKMERKNTYKLTRKEILINLFHFN